MNSNKLKGIIKERGKTNKACAKALGISEFQFRKKVNGQVGFWLEELAILAGFLRMTKKEFFDTFTPKVEFMEEEEK